jgi:hypothetical protein
MPINLAIRRHNTIVPRKRNGLPALAKPTKAGRSLFIAFPLRRHSDEVLIRPISARYMHQKEVDHYEKEITKI